MTALYISYRLLLFKSLHLQLNKEIINIIKTNFIVRSDYTALITTSNSLVYSFANSVAPDRQAHPLSLI